MSLILKRSIIYSSIAILNVACGGKHESAPTPAPEILIDSSSVPQVPSPSTTNFAAEVTETTQKSNVFLSKPEAKNVLSAIPPAHKVFQRLRCEDDYTDSNRFQPARDVACKFKVTVLGRSRYRH